MADTTTRDGMLVERTDLYRDGVMVSLTPFPGAFALTMTVRKEHELGSDHWRSASFSIPMRRLDTPEEVATYGRALLLLAEFGAELDAEFPESR